MEKESKIYNSIFGKMNYETYDKTHKIVSCLSPGLTIGNALLLGHNPIVSVFTWMLIISSYTMTLSHAPLYTKDVKEAKLLYQEFIKNYNKLNKIFDLNNPIEINTMFHYLLDRGYLSKNKKYEYGKYSNDIPGLLGSVIIMGTGVCRHTATMLNDILEDYGIESCQLPVYTRDFELKIEGSNDIIKPKEELFDWVKNNIIDPDEQDDAIEDIEELLEKYKGVDLSLKTVESNNIICKTFGNHMITYAYQDGNSYFLDPTEGDHYTIIKKRGVDIGNDEAALSFRNPLLTRQYYDRKMACKAVRRVEKGCQCLPYEESDNIYFKTEKMCWNNKDIFENFYHDNSELYDEITDKVLKIRKRK